MGVPGKSDLSEVERQWDEKESSRENEQWNNIRNTLLIAQFFSDVGLLSSNIYLFTSGLSLRGQQVSTIASVLFRFCLYSQCVCVCVCVSQSLSCVWLFATLWTVACQAPVSMGFSRQECWSRLPLGYLKDLLRKAIHTVLPEIGVIFIYRYM